MKTRSKAKLQIAHQVPGRIRMKIPSAKGDRARLEEYKQTLSAIPGIESIEVNPDTGSVVLKYDPDQHREFHSGFTDHCSRHHDQPHHRPPTNEIDALANKIEQEAEYLAEHSHVARVFVDLCKSTDRTIREHSNNTLDLKMLLAIGVIGVTVLEVGATAATPVWVTLALFGMNHFIEMQEQAAAQRTMQTAAVRA